MSTSPDPDHSGHTHATSPRRPSIPISASQLNNTPADLPSPPPPLSPPPSNTFTNPFNGTTDSNTNTSNHSNIPAPHANSDHTDFDSAYLDAEPPQHPTIAETGAMSPTHGPGPASGQLHRRESDAKRRIIRLASFGGEGLVAKPPAACEEQGSAIVD